MDASPSPAATATIRLDAPADARPTARPASPSTPTDPADADRRRFEALYERHARAVLAYARRRSDPQPAVVTLHAVLDLDEVDPAHHRPIDDQRVES